MPGFILKTYFSDTQVTLLLSASLCIIISLVCKLKNREKASLLMLTLGGGFLFCFAALLDPFVNLWDERFHALVAKNLVNHPLKPTLYDQTPIDFAHDRWDRFHIWVHKQPLFLWQIALSFKLFGISEFTLRLPNVLMGTALIPIVYRMGKLLVNKRVGFLAAILFLTDLFLLEILAGRQELEHNDYAFIFYITLSIWSLAEYYFTGNKKWIYLIGIFSGCAILCKWLVGLLVYLGWGILKLNEKKFRLSDNKDILISLAVTIAIALPWQVFSAIAYPEETRLAYKFFILHFTDALEGHRGNFWYHFAEFNRLYGMPASFLAIPGFLVLSMKIKLRPLIMPLIGMVLATYLFFSLAFTKMPAFTLVVFSIILVALAALLDFIFRWIERKFPFKFIRPAVSVFGVLLLVVIRFDITYLQEKYTLWRTNHHSRMLIENKAVFNQLQLAENAVLFNIKGQHNIDAMFYTNWIAYNILPDENQCRQLKQAGKIIVVFLRPDREIPDYLANDPEIIFVDELIQGYD